MLRTRFASWNLKVLSVGSVLASNVLELTLDDLGSIISQGKPPLVELSGPRYHISHTKRPHRERHLASHYYGVDTARSVHDMSYPVPENFGFTYILLL